MSSIPPMSVQRVLVLNGIIPVGVLDTFQEFSWTRTLYGLGDCLLVMDDTQFAQAGLMQGYFLGPVLGDGSLDHVYLIDDIHRETLQDGGEVIRITGQDVSQFVYMERIIDPGTAAYQTVTAVKAETAIKAFANAHAGPGATNVNRRIPNLVIAADAVRGSNVTEQGRFQTLGDMLRSLGERSVPLLGWDVSFNSVTGVHTLDVIAGVDRTATVFLDPTFDTAQKLQWLLKGSGKKTHVLVGGQGELLEREIVRRWVGTEPAGFARREAFLDARDSDDTTKLNERADAILTDTNKDSLECEVHPYGSFQYRRDFDLGDLVTIRSTKWNISRAVRIVSVKGSVGRDQRTAAITLELDHPFPTLEDALNPSSASVPPVPEALRRGPDGEIMLDGAGDGFVGRKTRLAGPQEDVHLRSGDASGSFAFVESRGNSYFTVNAYWDGVNWQRFDTTLPSLLFTADGTTKSFLLWGADAGTNPITWVPYGALEAVGAGHFQMKSLGATAAYLAASVSLQFGINAYVTPAGTAYNRYDTGAGSIVLSVSRTTIDLYTAVAGANPATLTNVASFTPATLGLVTNPPRARIYRNTNQTGVVTGSVTPLTLSTAAQNNAGAGPAVMWVVGTPTRMTIQVAGTYEVGGALSYAAQAGGSIRAILLRLNGGAFIASQYGATNTGNTIRVSAATQVALAVNDYIECCAFHDAGANATLVAANEELNLWASWKSIV